MQFFIDEADTWQCYVLCIIGPRLYLVCANSAFASVFLSTMAATFMKIERHDGL
jgi:hypothetical protein